MKMYQGKRVLVTGGASFIGSFLVEALVELGAKVSVIDNFSTGDQENLASVRSQIEIHEGDLFDQTQARNLITQAQPEIIFHLAAIHGGRGFIETYQKEILKNLVIDANVFTLGTAQGVESIVHASSACAYPINLQENESSRALLREGESNFDTPGGAFPDGVYGWVKLMGEFQLENLTKGTKTLGRAARIFTAYGERENETHAAVALVAKANLQMDPFEIWGSGNQTRNFTYVGDTVRGLLYLGQDRRGPNFDVFNVGQSTHWTVNQFVEEVINNSNYKPQRIVYNSDMPTGVASRAADNSKMQEVFGWQPDVDIRTGVNRLSHWYQGWSKKAKTKEELRTRLI